LLVTTSLIARWFMFTCNSISSSSMVKHYTG
jgi:hypothetical protein